MRYRQQQLRAAADGAGSSDSPGGGGARRRGAHQLLAVHRLPDKTELHATTGLTPAYTDVWDAATRRSRSRRVQQSHQPHR